MGLRIEEHADKYAKDCSGGTKRKLSYAMSMLGAPKIVLLDEPSTGMDPQSKRFVWDTIEATFQEGEGGYSFYIWLFLYLWLFFGISVKFWASLAVFRFVWDTIEASFQEGLGRGAILTTHSMEEADALCSRVGIMVKVCDYL